MVFSGDLREWIRRSVCFLILKFFQNYGILDRSRIIKIIINFDYGVLF